MSKFAGIAQQDTATVNPDGYEYTAWTIKMAREHVTAEALPILERVIQKTADMRKTGWALAYVFGRYGGRAGIREVKEQLIATFRTNSQNWYPDSETRREWNISCFDFQALDALVKCLREAMGVDALVRELTAALEADVDYQWSAEGVASDHPFETGCVLLKDEMTLFYRRGEEDARAAGEMLSTTAEAASPSEVEAMA